MHWYSQRAEHDSVLLYNAFVTTAHFGDRLSVEPTKGGKGNLHCTSTVVV